MTLTGLAMTLKGLAMTLGRGLAMTLKGLAMILRRGLAVAMAPVLAIAITVVAFTSLGEVCRWRLFWRLL
jgi:hypothetical protein